MNEYKNYITANGKNITIVRHFIDLLPLMIYNGYIYFGGEVYPIDDIEQIACRDDMADWQIDVLKEAVQYHQNNAQTDSANNNLGDLGFGEDILELAVTYHKLVGDDENLRQTLIDFKHGSLIVSYCIALGGDDQMRQAIVDFGTLTDINRYRLWFEDTEVMQQAYIDKAESMMKNKMTAVTLARLASKYGDRPLFYNYIINNPDPKALFEYCRDVENKTEVYELLLQSNRLHWIYEYGKVFGFTQEIIDKLIEQAPNTDKYATLLTYCKEYEPSEQIIQALLESNEPRVYAWYLVNGGHDNRIRQALVRSGDPKWASFYCVRLGADAEMRQIILDAGDPVHALNYCIKVKPDADMEKVIVASGNIEACKQYLNQVSVNTEMLKLVTKANQKKVSGA